MSEHDGDDHFSNQTDPLLGDNHRNRAGFFHRWFGCCLNRTTMSRRVSSYSEAEGYTNQDHPDEEVPQIALNSPLRFNAGKISTGQNNEKTTSTSDHPANKRTQLENETIYEEIKENSNHEDGDFQASSESRTSSTLRQTHNYFFDASSYVSDRVSICGNLMQLMLLVTEQHFILDLEANQNERLTISDSTLPLLQRKLFHRRALFFHDYDQGVRVNNSAWSELIYECVLQHVSKRGTISPRKEFVIDAFCRGSGQLTVNLSGYFSSVISIQPDPQKLAGAAHNATHYRIPNNLYQHTNRLSLNEGILFFRESDFLDDKFTIASNLSDIVFVSLITDSQTRERKDYFSKSQEFIEDLKNLLKKALILAPQVILIAPRETKISSVCEAFTDAIKDNLNTVKRCSIEVEKEMINGHLKYLVFYFGEFNFEKLSPAEEYRYINELLGKCLGKSNHGESQQLASQSAPLPVQIHNQVFSEIGKFQLLNIVLRFQESLKLLTVTLPLQKQQKPGSYQDSQETLLLKRFYGYLVEHGFLNQSKVDSLLPSKQQRKQEQPVEGGDDRTERTLSSLSYGSTISGNTTANIQEKVHAMKKISSKEHRTFQKDSKKEAESKSQAELSFFKKNQNMVKNVNADESAEGTQNSIALVQEDSSPAQKQQSQQLASMEKREFQSGEDEIVQSRLFSGGITESESDYEEEEENQEVQGDCSQINKNGRNDDAVAGDNTSKLYLQDQTDLTKQSSSLIRTQQDISNYRRTQQIFFTKMTSNVSNVSKSDDVSGMQLSNRQGNIVFRQEFFNSQKPIETSGNNRNEVPGNYLGIQGSSSRTSSEGIYPRFSVKSKSELAEASAVLVEESTNNKINNNNNDHSDPIDEESE